MNNKLCAVICVLATLLAALSFWIVLKGHRIIMEQNRIIQAQQIKIERIEKDNIGLLYANRYLKLLNSTVEDAWRDCKKGRRR